MSQDPTLVAEHRTPSGKDRTGRALHPGRLTAAAPMSVLVVGGGSAGLELCVRLSSDPLFKVGLVEPQPVHLWKPLLHEVASGSLDASAHEISYLALARWHKFTFHQGALVDLDQAGQVVTVSAVVDTSGEVIVPERRLTYDILVLALGGVTEDFGITGVRRHALFLDSIEHAERIREQLVKACMTANFESIRKPARFSVVIVGGGATGVELAAELHGATRALISYGLDKLDPERFLSLTVVNADPRLLPQLSPELSEAIANSLVAMGIAVFNAESVVAVEADRVRTKAGREITSDMTIWAAGVRGPRTAFTGELERNRRGQFVVGPDLRTRVPNIFAIGDCAAIPLPGSTRFAPASAQAAHQEAAHLATHMRKVVNGKPIPPFLYRDFGALVSLGSERSAIGTLMGFITGHNYRVRGYLARLFYRWLSLQHRAVLLGWRQAIVEAFALSLSATTRPRVKLH